MTNLTSPRARWRPGDPMAAYDRLPADLRAWLATAALPWSATSALRLWCRAMSETGCPKAARDRLTRAEAKTLAREARRVWGAGYPTLPPAAATAPDQQVFQLTQPQAAKPSPTNLPR